MPALRRLAPLLWLGPAIALIGVVVLWPVVVMVQSSFQHIGGEGFVAGYNGTANFRHLFDEPDFVSVLLRTVVWVVVVVAVTVLISLGLAQLFNQRFPGRRVARWALIIPWAASVMMTALIFKWALDPNVGVINVILHHLGVVKQLGSNQADWLGNPTSALLWMMGVAVFVSLPFTTYAILSGLQGIPRRRVRGGLHRRRDLVEVLPAGHAAAAAAGDPGGDADQRHQRLQLLPDHLGDDPRRPRLRDRHHAPSTWSTSSRATSASRRPCRSSTSCS